MVAPWVCVENPQMPLHYVEIAVRVALAYSFSFKLYISYILHGLYVYECNRRRIHLSSKLFHKVMYAVTALIFLRRIKSTVPIILVHVEKTQPAATKFSFFIILLLPITTTKMATMMATITIRTV